MKKSGVLTFLGPLIVIFGAIFSSRITYMILGEKAYVTYNNSSYTGLSEAYFNYNHWIGLIVTVSGIMLFILGTIFVLLERRHDSEQKYAKLNAILIKAGIVTSIGIIITFFVIARILSGLS